MGAAREGGGKRERPGQAGRRRGRWLEAGSGEEEVKRTVPGRGSEASLYKIRTFFSLPSSFHGNIVFLLHHLLNKLT